MNTKAWVVIATGALVAILCLSLAHGATLEWNPVTRYTDGTPIALPVYYQMYTAPPGGEWSASGDQTQALVGYPPDPVPGGTMFYTVAAIVGGEESEKGAAVSKTAPFSPVPVRVPAAPSGVRVR
jgi:hypothetical protein